MKTGIERQGGTFAPTILISDASDAIRNGFDEVFDNTKKIMCFVHVERNCAKQPLNNNKNRKEILNDLKQMNIATSEDHFKELSRLFLDKYRDCEPEFVEYFERQWLGDHCNWYEAASIYTPSTNNNLEGQLTVSKFIFYGLCCAITFLCKNFQAITAS